MCHFVFKTIGHMNGREMFCVERLRCNVFVTEEKITLPELDDEDLRAVQVYLLNSKKTIALATCRLFKKDNDWQLGRVAVAKSVRHQGLATKMLKEVHLFLQKRGIKSLHCHAQLTAVPLYENLGYQRQGSIFYEDGIKHVVMTKHFK